MKWFTRGWHEGELSEPEADRIRRSYWEHIEGIRGKLEPAVADLACNCNLHDAIIEYVAVYRRWHRIVLSLVAGDLQEGYREVVLDYLDVQIGDHYRGILRRRAGDRETCILYDEVDIEADGSYVHRLMFWPEGEVSIWFRHLRLSSAPREDRRICLPGGFVERD